MRKLLTTAALAALASATPAFAADQNATQVNASAAPVCKVTAQSTSLTLAAVDEAVEGVFKYTCNFVGSPVLTFTSANGGVKTAENGGSTSDYGIYLNDAPYTSYPISQWLKASQSTGGVSYAGNGGPSITVSNPANQEVTASFALALRQPLAVAGSYSDTLTINVNP